MIATETQVKTYKNSKDYQHDIKKMSKQGWTVASTAVDKEHHLLRRDKQEIVVTYQRVSREAQDKGMSQSQPVTQTTPLQPMQVRPKQTLSLVQQRRSLSPRAVLIIAITSFVVVFAIIFAVILGGSQGTSPSADTSSTTTSDQSTSSPPTPQPTLTLDQQISQLAQNAGSNGTNIIIHYNADGNNGVVIDEQSQGGFTNGMTVESIKIDCWDFQKALWTSSLTSKISAVTVHVDGGLVDKYGHTSNGLWGSCELTSATAQNFVWANLDQDQAWGDYDDTFILPSLLS